jgi:hypothetical protein
LRGVGHGQRIFARRKRGPVLAKQRFNPVEAGEWSLDTQNLASPAVGEEDLPPASTENDACAKSVEDRR